VSIDQTVSDFDGVIFHISTPETKSKIMVSIQIRCYSDLVRYGAEQVLNREYGPYVVAPEPGYDFSVLVDLDNLPAEKGQCFSQTMGRECLRLTGNVVINRCA
jgi:actin related protein 2/3 complex, subunit 2